LINQQFNSDLIIMKLLKTFKFQKSFQKIKILQILQIIQHMNKCDISYKI